MVSNFLHDFGTVGFYVQDSMNMSWIEQAMIWLTVVT